MRPLRWSRRLRHRGIVGGGVVFSLGMGLFKGKKAKGPQRYNLPNGQTLECVVCRGQYFDRRHYKLNTSGMEFLDLAWANRDATCLVCVSCRHIHWFDF